MNIVVCMKQTFDTEAKIALKDGKIEDTGVELVINPYDEFAIEEALRLREAAGEGEVVLVSVGGKDASKALRTGLAMGADRAVLINDPALENPDEWATAVALSKAVSSVNCDIVLAGRMATDGGSSQVAIRIADALGLPSVSGVVKLNTIDGKATAIKEIDGGSEEIEVALPAVFTAQKGLNEPRLPSMAGIMKSKKKEIKEVTLADLGLGANDVTPKASIEEYSLPAPRSGGKIVGGEAADAAKELARLLREEAKAV